MTRVIVLDSTPLGLAAGPPGSLPAYLCRTWLSDLVKAGVRIIVPEICDYEVRRKFLHTSIRNGLPSPAGIQRLNDLATRHEYLPISTDAMRLAAGFWAALQASGQPTASEKALDADAILAAQASLAGGSGDIVTVATSNVRHLSRFTGIDAREWSSIRP
ncbi:MAG TPA: hypothetical protein VFT74_19740 [Isosphaeraceae bacterium]|nr:hypothetical protein [Isosphaeraceae bacterium]